MGTGTWGKNNSDDDVGVGVGMDMALGGYFDGQTSKRPRYVDRCET